MAWAVAIAALALALLWILLGFVGELMDYRRHLEEKRGDSWTRRRP